MKVAIYARVSTDANEEKQNPERQVLKCKQYCELHNHSIIEVVRDYSTGSISLFERPGGKVINDLIKRGKINGIVVFSLDRFSREHPTKVIEQLKRLKSMGIKFTSVSESFFNMEDEMMSDLIIFLVGWVNSWFLKKLVKDIKSGMEKARASGAQIGRPKVDVDIEKVRELRSQGLSWRAVSREMGQSLGTVFTAFKKGSQKQGKILGKEVAETAAKNAV